MTDLIPPGFDNAKHAEHPDAVLRSPHSVDEVTRRLNVLLKRTGIFSFSKYREKVDGGEFLLESAMPAQRGFSFELLVVTVKGSASGSQVIGRFRKNWMTIAIPAVVVSMILIQYILHPGNFAVTPPAHFNIPFLIACIIAAGFSVYSAHRTALAQRRNIIRDLADYLDAEIDVLPPSELKQPPPKDGTFPS